MPVPTNVPFYVVVCGSFEPIIVERDVERCTWASTVEDISRLQFENLNMVLEIGTGRNVTDRMVREAAYLRAERCDDYSHKFFELVELNAGTRAARALVR